MINLFYNELLKAFYKRRTYISFILISLLIPAIVYAIDYGAVSLETKIYGQMQDSFIFIGSIINGYLSAYLIIAILITHMPFLSTIIPSEIISGEYSKGTFRIYLTRAILRRDVFIAKVFVVFLYTSMMMFYFFLYSLIISYFILGDGELIVFHKGILLLSEDDIIWRFMLGFIFSNFVMITVASLCLFFSSFSKNSVTPIISTISIVFVGSAISFIPIDIFELIDPYLFTGYIDIFLLAFHYPVPNEIFINCFLVCFSWSFLFILMAYFNFTNRDILE
jgi:ABC-2 type transport system permease protein